MLPVMVFEANTKGELTFLNQTTIEVLGVKKEKIKKGINIFDFFANQEHYRLRKTVRTLIKEGKIRSQEFSLINKEKNIITGLVYMNLIIHQNLPMGMRCVIVDISERKIYEEQIKTTEIRLKNAQKVAHIGTWEYNFVKKTSYWSDETFRILGYCRDKPCADFQLLINHIHPDYKRFISQILATALEDTQKEQEYKIDYEYYILTANKIKKFVRLKADIERDKNGKATKIYGTLHDITNRKVAEEKINLSIQRQEITSQIRHIFQSNNKLMFTQRIKQVLEILGNILGLSRIFIFEDINEQIMVKKYEWKSPTWKDKTLLPQELEKINIDDSLKKITEESFLLYNKFTKEAKEDLYTLFANQKIKSLLAYPILVKSKVHALFFLTQNDMYRKWQNNNVNLLGAIAYIISDAYERELYDISLRQKAEEREKFCSH